MRWLAEHCIQRKCDAKNWTRRSDMDTTHGMYGSSVAIVWCNPTTTTVKLSNWNFNQFIWPVQPHERRTRIFSRPSQSHYLLSCCFLTAWRIPMVHRRSFHEIIIITIIIISLPQSTQSQNILVTQLNCRAWTLHKSERVPSSSAWMCAVSLGRSYTTLFKNAPYFYELSRDWTELSENLNSMAHVFSRKEIWMVDPMNSSIFITHFSLLSSLQTTIKVFTACLRLDIEYKTLGIQWDSTSKDVVAQLLRRYVLYRCLWPSRRPTKKLILIFFHFAIPSWCSDVKCDSATHVYSTWRWRWLYGKLASELYWY